MKNLFIKNKKEILRLRLRMTPHPVFARLMKSAEAISSKGRDCFAPHTMTLSEGLGMT
jgi:hypothetical protein